MRAESYTPGHSQNATDFMAKRSLQSHGEFFRPYLTPGVSVLDCGCGPGAITLGIAECIAPGAVMGVDFAASQVERAIATATSAGIKNIAFQTADCYSLPFDDNSFDRVFSHALMEHLSDQALACRELSRVLNPGGVTGACSPDWGGFMLSPPSSAFIAAQNKRWVLVAPPGSRESKLLLARAVGAEQSSRIGNQTGGRVFLFLHTDNFWRDFNAYKSKGVVFVRQPAEESYGTVAVFKDLYGNLWDLLQLKQ